jgi:hypothetical protein
VAQGLLVLEQLGDDLAQDGNRGQQTAVNTTPTARLPSRRRAAPAPGNGRLVRNQAAQRPVVLGNKATGLDDLVPLLAWRPSLFIRHLAAEL